MGNPREWKYFRKADRIRMALDPSKIASYLYVEQEGNGPIDERAAIIIGQF